MSTKRMPARAHTTYFAETRDYMKVVEAEAGFFKGLVMARAQLPTTESLDATIRHMTGFIQDPKGREVNLTVEFDVRDPRKGTAYKLFLGTRLSPPKPNSNAEATHYLCIANENSLLAKFHADFDFDPSAAEKKPSPHVQIGGRIPPALLSRYSNQYWHTDVNKPRLPSLPISTALLWHWAFLEYQGDEMFAKFLKNDWWKKLIKDAESAVLRPFFEDGRRLMLDHPEKGLLNALYVPLNR